MLTSTVARPGELNIMRTGMALTGTPTCSAASACNISV